MALSVSTCAQRGLSHFTGYPGSALALGGPPAPCSRESPAHGLASDQTARLRSLLAGPGLALSHPHTCLQRVAASQLVLQPVVTEQGKATWFLF